MSIPDLTPTDLAKNLIGVGIVGVTLALYCANEPIPTQLDVAFWVVLGAYGFAVAKPVVSDVLKKVYGK